MRSHRHRTSGFSLIEIVIAISVIAVTFIGIIGLLSLGVANDQTSSDQTIATNIAASLVADLRSTPSYSTTGKTPRYGMTLPATVTLTPTAPLSGVAPSYLYFDNSAKPLPLASPTIYATAQTPPPAGAVYLATVYLTQIVSMGTAPAQAVDMTRIVVSWPAQTQVAPSGSVDVITQFRIN